MTSTRRVTSRGDWPGPVALRSGWWKAVARRLNDDTDEVALRVERGSVEFLERCAEWAFDQGVPAVWSPPLSGPTAGMWRSAGFEPDRRLLMMERRLDAPSPVNGPAPREGTTAELAAAAGIDRAAFEGIWRMGRVGLEDAMSATPRSVLLLVDDEQGETMAFAIVGMALHTSYLQRIAVDPARQGTGVGRALLRRSVAWARGAGGRTMLLNTQMDNHVAASLYRSEGFIALPSGLTLYRRALAPPIP
jgi:GNAT superfamily N-acetyltransferase